MANIIFADTTRQYDGRSLESEPLGGTESSVIRLARELARRRHDVTVYSNCDAPIEHEGRALAADSRRRAAGVRSLCGDPAPEPARLRETSAPACDLGAVAAQSSQALQADLADVVVSADSDAHQPASGPHLFAVPAAPRAAYRAAARTAGRHARPAAARDAAPRRAPSSPPIRSAICVVLSRSGRSTSCRAFPMRCSTSMASTTSGPASTRGMCGAERCCRPGCRPR